MAQPTSPQPEGAITVFRSHSIRDAAFLECLALQDNGFTPRTLRSRIWPAPGVSNMKRRIATFLLLLATVTTAAAQQAPLTSPLLDHMTGHWVLRGEIAGKPTTHDVDADWVIQHHYVRLHEVSRDKNAQGQPQYEALIFVGFTEASKTYSCVWLDVYGGTAIESIGVADPRENQLLFVFKDEKGEVSFRNDFIYDPATASWEWRMDNVVNGAPKPFGRVKLTRK
jgi:hypothetical protein